MLDEHLPPDRAGVVLHWFTGSKADVRRAVDRGCYFSVNEGMLASATGLRVMREIPIDRVLTETDGPFLTRGDKRSEEHTSELQSLMRISYAVFCLKKKNKQHTTETIIN